MTFPVNSDQRRALRRLARADALADKQDTLVSGTNIKTINGSTVLGSGDLSIGGSVADGDKGDITVSSSGTVWTIDNSAVTLAKQADMATASVVYRKTAGSGAPEVQTLATLKTDLGLTGTNSGDQTSIVGITGTTAQFNTALSDADFATGGGTATGTNTGDQTTIVGITGTKAQFDTAVTDGNILYVGDVTTNATHTGDATGSGALTVVALQGKAFPTLSGADDQKYPKYVSGSNAFVMTTIAGGGDVTGPASSVDDEIALFSSTTGKVIKRASTTGILKATSGVLSAATAGTDYGRPYVHVSKSAGATTTGANTTPVSVTDAVFTYEASSTYWIRVMGRLNPTAATTGAAIQFDLSSAVTAIDVQSVVMLPGLPLTAFALLVTGANTGTCQLRFRSETAAAAVTELMAGTVMIVEKVQ